VTIASITESVNPATETIDTMSTPMIVAAIQAEDAKVAAAVAAVGDAIAQLIDVAAARMQRRTGSLCWACSPDGASVRVVGVYQTP